MHNTFDYVKENGIQDGADYPYIAKYGTCKQVPEQSSFFVTGYVDLPKGDEIALQEAVANVGPVSVAVENSGMGYRFYGSGMYS